MEEQHFQGYFYIIPSELVEQKDHTKALLFGLIVSLADKKGYCWASNEFLAKKLGLKDISIISTRISELTEEGWLEREVEGNKRKLIIRMKTKALVKTKASFGEDQSNALVETKDSNINEYNKKSIRKENQKIPLRKCERCGEDLVWIYGLGWQHRFGFCYPYKQ